MAIHLTSRHATCSASRPLGEMATQSATFNNVRLLNVYEIVCVCVCIYIYIRRIAHIVNVASCQFLLFLWCCFNVHTRSFVAPVSDEL